MKKYIEFFLYAFIIFIISIMFGSVSAVASGYVLSRKNFNRFTINFEYRTIFFAWGLSIAIYILYLFSPPSASSNILTSISKIRLLPSASSMGVVRGNEEFFVSFLFELTGQIVLSIITGWSAFNYRLEKNEHQFTAENGLGGGSFTTKMTRKAYLAYAALFIVVCYIGGPESKRVYFFYLFIFPVAPIAGALSVAYFSTRYNSGENNSR